MTPAPTGGQWMPEEVPFLPCQGRGPGTNPTLAKGGGGSSREDCKGGLDSQSIYKLIDHTTA